MFVDPRLREKWDELRVGDTLRVVVVARSAARARRRLDERGSMGAVVDALALQLGEPPTVLCYLPRGGMGILRADGRVLEALCAHPAVEALSAADVDRVCLT